MEQWQNRRFDLFHFHLVIETAALPQRGALSFLTFDSGATKNYAQLVSIFGDEALFNGLGTGAQGLLQASGPQVVWATGSQQFTYAAVGQVGVDSVTAAAPEPATFSLLGLGLGLASVSHTNDRAGGMLPKSSPPSPVRHPRAFIHRSGTCGCRFLLLIPPIKPCRGFRCGRRASPNGPNE